MALVVRGFQKKGKNNLFHLSCVALSGSRELPVPAVSGSAPPPRSVMTDTGDRDGWGASTSCETAACLAPSLLLQEPRGCFHHPTGTDRHWEGFAAEESPAVPSVCETADPAVTWHIRHGQVSHTVSPSSVSWCTSFAPWPWDRVCFSSEPLPQAQIWE